RDQAVCARDGHGRVVDELRLDDLPALHVASPGRLGQRPDVQLLAPLLARGKLALGFALALGRPDRPVVLGAESVVQPARPPPSQRLPNQHAERDDDTYRYKHPNPPGHEATSFT